MATTTIEMENHTVTIVGPVLTIQVRKPTKGDMFAILSKSYENPHSMRVIVGRLMGAKDPEGFLASLICRIKQDMVREGKL